MSLGIFNRLFVLLEEECQRLDLEMAARQSGEQLGGGSFQRYVHALRRLATLKEERQMEEQKALLCTQLATYQSLQLSAPHMNPIVQRLRQEASIAKRELDKMVNNTSQYQIHVPVAVSQLQDAAIAETSKVLEEKYQPKDGPFYRTLDPALAQLHVERQAYHGGTFVGNHVHKLLKVQTAQNQDKYM